MISPSPKSNHATVPHPDIYAIVSDPAIYKRLKWRAMRMINFDSHLADDLVQETVLRLLKTKRFDPAKSSAAAYAFMRLRSTVDEWFRKREKGNSSMMGSTLVSDPISPEVADPVVIAESQQRIRIAMARVPERSRIVLESFGNGETLDELGEKLSINVRAGSYLRRVAFTNLFSEMLSR